ncbi:universal stress protein [Streptosporangium sp. NPDC001559]|uniref:universal stress protein n=1 Tax=Streptosporangium sp. NPDC001559 TaxID=3366187 RepID=UPI0036EF9F66
MQYNADQRPVVAGYDGSEASERALRWAAEEARLRFAPLVVCHAWQWSQGTPVPLASMETVQRLGSQVLDKGVDLARRLAPRIEVRTSLDLGSPSVVLMSESGAADLLVVGRRGSGGFAELRIGSTAVQLAAHAYCPVAVVGERPGPPTNLVVVGVDATAPERLELRLAFEQAWLRKASLRAICLLPEEARDTREYMVGFRRAVSILEERYGQVNVETTVVDDAHVAALQRAAQDADLVVVGDRGWDDPAELPLGVLCQALLRGAPCPVVVTPSHRPLSASR